MNIIPTEGRVLVKVEKAETTKGGLILPTVAQEKTLGYGLCVSGGFKGKYVWYKKYSGEEVKDGDTSYEIVDEEDILAYQKK